jgi:hypothetical protein
MESDAKKARNFQRTVGERAWSRMSIGGFCGRRGLQESG